MKKFVFSCLIVGMVYAMTGCSTNFVGEPKNPEIPVINNNYYFIIISEEKALKADHRKQRGKSEKFSGGPRHRDNTSGKTPGNPGARR